MELDLNRKMGSYLPSQGAFVRTMLEVQRHLMVRADPDYWASHLRFIEVPRMAEVEFHSIASITLRLTAKTEHPAETAYVAVSYCWNSFDVDTNRSGPLYYIRTTDGIRRNRAPASVLDRSICHALNRGIYFIWIDQECIDQDDPQDLQEGVQCMDKVYGLSNNPIGLLSVRLVDDETLEIFQQLLTHFEMHFSQLIATWADALEPRTVTNMVALLRDIASDRWFTRCWTYQEASCAKDRMTFLVQGSSNKEPPSNVSFQLSALWGAASWIRNLADEKFGQRPEIPGWSVMARLCYQAWEQRKRNSRPCDYQVAYSLQHRHNLVVEDRLAITANLCGYTKRLDIATIGSTGYSYSTCAFGLALLNGSIHPQGCSDLFECTKRPKIRWRTMSIYEFLESPAHCSGVVGNSRRNEPRLPEVILRRSGLETSGWLWTVGRKVCVPRLQARYVQFVSEWPRGRDAKLKCCKKILVDLIDELRHMQLSSLAHSAAECLGIDSNGLQQNRSGDQFSLDPFRSAPWFFSMLRKIIKRGYIWCGAICGEDELKGIFDVKESCMVFTATDVNLENIAQPLAAHNFLTFKVSFKTEASNSIQHLQYSTTNVNAIWLAPETSMKRYIFPWASESYHNDPVSDEFLTSPSSDESD
ncbi:hypothetical protein TruAng_012007 [Truncatella angustata]|nr:hypothetical protein TruAng_012007 [Truncatella angustata]